MARRTLTDVGVRALKPRATRYAVADPELRGHYVRVALTGAKTFLAVTRSPGGKQVWTTIGPADALTIEDARTKARDALNRVRAGLPAFATPQKKADTVADVAEQWLKRHVQAKGLRSEGEVTRLLKAHVLPAWGDREFLSIRRSDVAALLDEVQDDHGARQADYVLAIVRAICNWFATRHDTYQSPVARGMRRTDPKTRKRARLLDDDELRAVWRAAESSGRFGSMVRLALLTAQRREKIAGLRWEDVSLDGVWTVPAEDRAKGTGGVLLHARLPAETPQWQLHDLRRTARSLMSRAGVRPDVSERVMGHSIRGVEGIYDRHSYRNEKADALRRLSALVESIVSGSAGNVIQLSDAAVRA